MVFIISLLQKYFSTDDIDKYGNIPIFYALRNQNSVSIFWRTAIFELLKPSNTDHRNQHGEILADLARKFMNENTKNILRQFCHIE